MTETLKIDFADLSKINVLSQVGAREASGKAEKSRTVVIFAGQDLSFGPTTLQLIGETGEALVKKAASAVKFKGKALSTLDLVLPAGLAVERLLVIGTDRESGGERQEGKNGEGKGAKEVGSEPEDTTILGGYVMGKLGHAAQATIILDWPRPPEDKVQASVDFASGLRLRDYRFDEYKTKKKEDADSEEVSHILIAVDKPAVVRQQAKAADAVTAGVLTARSLVNEPANILYPRAFAERALALKKLGVEVTILDQGALQEIGMAALLGVGKGSARESQVVLMRWHGGRSGKTAKTKAKPIAFVGKGVCFDTGGISIKPAAGMEDMKGDMAGAACVVGLMQALAERKANADVIGAIGLVENMPGPEAQRPGDIVKSLSGQTIEVINTDAEGRLVLADLLWYVQDKFKPAFIVDLATLTGAILVALGHEHAGLFTNNEQLGERLIAAGKATGEKLWRLPLGPAYDKLIDSKVADVKNTGGRHAGSITAAQFLQRFVNKTPWAHLDIAGTGMGSPSNEINQSWASGFGVRLLNRLVADYY